MLPAYRGAEVGQDGNPAGSEAERQAVKVRKLATASRHRGTFLAGIVLSLRTPITGRANAGWSVMMDVARIKGKWGILGVGNVYP